MSRSRSMINTKKRNKIRRGCGGNSRRIDSNCSGRTALEVLYMA